MACFTTVFSTVEMSRASEPSLQWGRLQSTRQTVTPATSAAKPVHTQRMIRDSQVVAAAWEEADASLQADDTPEVQYIADGRSVVVKRSTIVEAEKPEATEPSFVEERFAQLPYDPFDETPENGTPEDETPEDGTPENEMPEDGMFDEPMPEPEIPEVQDALEDEIDRPDAEEDYDLFDDPSAIESSDESVDDESPETDSPRDLDLDLTPTIEDDDTSLEDVDTSLFDAMTLDDEDLLGEGSEESLQYGVDFDLSLPQPPTGEMTEEQRRLLAEERAASEESCREEIEKLRAQTLETIDLNIRVEGSMGEDYPFECPLESGQQEPRQWPQITYTWKAAGLCHKPLYFEQVQLERYGHSWGPYAQPIMSGVHFFGTLPILPYKMGLKTPNECVYTLGYYRPGNCAPYLVGGVPFTWRAAAFEAGVATGMSFIFP